MKCRHFFQFKKKQYVGMYNTLFFLLLLTLSYAIKIILLLIQVLKKHCTKLHYIKMLKLNPKKCKTADTTFYFLFLLTLSYAMLLFLIHYRLLKVLSYHVLTKCTVPLMHENIQ